MGRGWLLLGILLLTSTAAVASQGDVGWRSPDGSPAPQTEWRKSREGFGGWLLITPDADWREKWETPPEETPSLNTTDRVAMGETITALIFFVNPAVGENGHIDIRCDLRVIRPDGTTAADVPGLECKTGALAGSPYNMRLSEPALQFVGEPGDPLGEWVIEVDLTDVHRGVTLSLKGRFVLEE